jgi:hypothetical protein
VEKVNIGVRSSKNPSSAQEHRIRFKHYAAQRNRADLKKLHYDGARKFERDLFDGSTFPVSFQVRIPLDEVREDWLSSGYYSDSLRMIAEYYGLFDDLFKHGYFIPRVPLHVNYPYDAEQVTPVYSGNRLYAKDVISSRMGRRTTKASSFSALLGQGKASGAMENERQCKGCLHTGAHKSRWTSQGRRR